MPLYKNYCLVSKDFQKVENLDRNRINIKKNLLKIKQKETREKMNKIEDKVKHRVALLAKQKNTSKEI